MPRLYLSYRRTDSPAISERIKQRLVGRYGRASVIFDHFVPFGIDFRVHLQEEVGHSDMMIAVIGRNWAGGGKIRNPTDPVRCEIETALRRNIVVVPILVDGAPMPAPEELPHELHDLAYRHALQVDKFETFDRDMDRLIHVIDDRLHREKPAAMAHAPPPTASARGKTAAKIVGVTAVGAVGVAVVAAAPAVAAAIAVGTLALGGGAALVAGSVAAVKGLSRRRDRKQQPAPADVELRTVSLGPATKLAAPHLAAPQATAPDAASAERDVMIARRSMHEPTTSAPDSTPRQAAAAVKAKDEDDVECSVFAPARPERNRTILVQALLHRTEQLGAAVKMALEIDSSANRKGVAKLTKRIKRGVSVQLFLEIPTLAITAPFQEIVWSGEPARVVYAVDVPTAAPLGPCQGTLHIMIGGVPVGEVIFMLHIEAQKTPRPAAVAAAMAQVTPSGDAPDQRLDQVAVDAVQFRKAFVSYSRKDAPKVYLYAEALEDCGIKVLADVTDIEPGAEWKRELVTLINDADVFYLMWSSNAKQSPWVAIESQTAVARYDRESGALPRIRPVVIEEKAPDPPDYLARFQFNSKWLNLRVAQGQKMFAPSSRTD